MSLSTPPHSSQIIDLPPPKRMIVLLLVIYFDHLCGNSAMCLIVCLIVKYIHFLLYSYLTNVPVCHAGGG